MYVLSHALQCTPVEARVNNELVYINNVVYLFLLVYLLKDSISRLSHLTLSSLSQVVYDFNTLFGT